MNRSHSEGKGGSRPIVSSTTNTRLSGSWLAIARVVWLVLVVPSLGLFVLGLPVYYQHLLRVCGDPTVCSSLPWVLTVKGLQALSTAGVSIRVYALLCTIFSALITAIWCAVGFLMYWRRSDDWLALLAALFLVTSTTTPSSGNPTYALALAYPAFALLFSLVSFLGGVSLAGFFLFFPNGRLIPRWMGVILLLAIIEAFLSTFPSPVSSFNTNWPAGLYLLVTGAIYVSLIFSQLYRYRRVSTSLQRQQTKWIILGATAVVAFYLLTFVLSLLFPSLQNPNSSSGVAVAAIVLNFLFSVVFLSIPLSIGFSILRYRLYDIDVLINRALVYGSLTVLLALLYFGLIVALQSLFQGVFHQSNAVVIVVSTLVIAALFQPLRHRIQAIIDRRFYRRKYDAARTLAAFSATLRNEVDLASLSEHLVAVVQETMQPTHISLWLSKDDQRRKPHPDM